MKSPFLTYVLDIMRKSSNILRGYTFFNKESFHKRRQVEIGKNQEILSHTLRLNFDYLKIIHILHQCYHPKKKKKKKKKKASLFVFMRL